MTAAEVALFAFVYLAASFVLAVLIGKAFAAADRSYRPVVEDFPGAALDRARNGQGPQR